MHSCLLERVMSGETLVPRHQLRQFLEQLQGGCRNSYPYPAAEKQYKVTTGLFYNPVSVPNPTRSDPMCVVMYDSEIELI